MDAWKPEELKKMQCGGNGKFNAFLKKYGVEKSTDINKKYNSKAAEVRESNRRDDNFCRRHFLTVEWTTSAYTNPSLYLMVLSIVSCY